MKPAMEAELFGGTTDVAPPNDQIYPSLSNDRIPTFVRNCSLYDQITKTWKDLAAAEQKKGEVILYEPYKAIIASVLSEFQDHTREDCWVTNTHTSRMKYIEGNQVCNEDLPDGRKKQVILNTRQTLPDYDHGLAPVEIKQASTYNARTALIQAGVYAKQCFVHQPHRRYVPALVIAGSDLYLHIYDRSGVLRLDRINVHQDPATFVRIILGVSNVSTDVRSSPFDLRVRYEGGNVLPRINVKNNTLNFNEQYTVTATKFYRKNIRGRGTYCSIAEGKVEGKVTAVIIKEAWRTLDRSPEYELLKDIQGGKGVGQILHYEDDDSTVKDFRQHVFPAFCNNMPYDLDRKFCRLILKAYGRSVRHFNTKLELLGAFHDAIAGHKYLWQKGILHRDVSVDNILLGEPGAPEGYRGVLIDFDKAVRVNHVSDTTKTRTGIKAFQSYAILKCGTWGNLSPPQDHLDDLESYLYCLSWICIKYNETSSEISSPFLLDWEHEMAEDCAHHKSDFLLDPTFHVTPYFKTLIFRRLLLKCGALCQETIRSKVSTVTLEEPFPSLEQVHAATFKGQDHDKFLELFKTAIAEQTSAGEEVARRRTNSILTQYPISQEEYLGHKHPSPPSTDEMGRLVLKRPNNTLIDQEEEERGFTSKRPRTRNAGQPSLESRFGAPEGLPQASGSKLKESGSQPRASGSRVRASRNQRGSGSKRVGK